MTSSVAGFAPLVGRTGYAASKHALHGFFDTLRAELVGSGVTVTLACPAFTATAIRRNALDASGGRTGRGAPGSPQLTPETVATHVVDAVRRRRRQVVIGPIARASWWVSRFAPTLYERLMRWSQASECKAAGEEDPERMSCPG